MAGNTVNIDLNIRSNGSLKEHVKDSDKLANNMTRANREGAKASSMQYGRARGASGLTGASARDFANEQQGLGGLVRLYATVAANTYAAAAAFGVLKEAANTSNIVKGLDQLGASSGIALGALSQNFVKATDNAISLRDAMSAVAKGSSAGLSSTQMMDLAKVATKASQVLGLDTTDAISRLTRAATKLEPELVDELGLFTKIGKATEDYAKKIGKTAEQLTDFQKRQAYANALLKEGKEKYNEINIDANPYAQLEAALRNIAQTGLELLNKFITPLASVLSGNTALLSLAVGGLVAKLATMAIPALTSWRQNLVMSADVAKSKAREINESFGEKWVEKISAKFDLPKLQKNLGDAQKSYENYRKNLLDIDNGFINKGANASNAYKAIAQGGPLTDEGRKAIEKDINKLVKERANLTGDEATRHDRLIAQRKTLLDLDAQVRQNRQIENTAFEKANQKIEGTNFEAYQREKISRRAGAMAERTSAVAAVGSNVEYGGFGYGLDQLNKAISSSSEMNNWDKFRTKVTGTLAASTAAVSVFLQAFGTWAQVIGLGIAAVGLLDAALSKSTKQLEAFRDQLDLVSKTADNADRVLKKFESNRNSGAAIIAQATAATELGTQADQAVEKYVTALRSMTDSKFEQGKEGWQQIGGKVLNFISAGFFSGNFGEQFNLAENVAKAIEKQLQLIPEGPAKQAAQEKIKKILGSSGFDKKTIEDAIKSKSMQGASALASQLLAANAPAVDAYAGQKQKLVDLKDASTAANTALTNLKNSMIDKTPLSEFAAATLVLGNRIGNLSSAGTDANTTLAGLQDLLKDPVSVQFIDPASVQALQGAEVQLRNLVPQIDDTKEKLDRLKGIRSQFEETGFLADTQEAQKIQQQINTYEIVLQLKEGALERIKDNIQGVSIKIIENSFSIMKAKSDAVLKMADIASTRKILAGLPSDLPGVAQAQTRLTIQELGVQKAQLTVTQTLVDATYKQSLIGSESNAINAQRLIIDKAILEKREYTPDEKKSLETYSLEQSGFRTLLNKPDGLTPKELSSLPTSAQNAYSSYLRTNEGNRTQIGVIDKQIATERKLLTLENEQDARKKAQDRLKEDREKAELAAKNNALEFISLEYMNEGMLAEKQKIENNLQLLKIQEERITLSNLEEQVLDRIKALGNKPDPGILSELKKARDEVNTRLNDLNAQDKLKTDAKSIADDQEKITLQFIVQNRNLDYQQKLRNQALSDANAALDVEDNRLQLLKQFNGITDVEAVKADADIKRKKLDLDLTKQLGDTQVDYQRNINRINEDLEKAKAAATKEGKTVNEQGYNDRKREAVILATKELQAIQDASYYKREQLDIEEKLNRLRAERIERDKKADFENALRGERAKQFGMGISGLPYLGQSQIATKQEYARQDLLTTQLRERLAIQDKIAENQKIIMEDESEGYSTKVQTALTAQLQLNTDLARLKVIQAEQSVTFAMEQLDERRENLFAKQAADRAELVAKQEQSLAYNQQENSIAQELLGLKAQTTLMLPDELAGKEKILKVEEATLTLQSRINAAENKRRDDLAQLDSQKAKLLDPTFVGPVNPEDLAALEQRRRLVESGYESEIALAKRANDARKTAIDLQYSMTDRMKSYDQVFQNTFSNMTDAILNFVKTGKFSFKDLIDSMVSQLFRYELQRGLMALYAPGDAGTQYGGGLRQMAMSGLSRYFGGISSTGASGYSDMNTFNALMATGTGLAKGGAFDQGYPIHPFAMGGAFTNSIVNSPTLFKFASGTGLMGEAGPEAIMPLKRSSNGILGVRAETGNVQVVVNNHTGQKAETRETVDSRGQRTVEVIVGDMVSQQLATKGSSMQQTLATTYGSKPALTRR